MEVTLPKWPNQETAENFWSQLSYKKQFCWLSFMLVERCSFLQEFKICLNYISKHSVRRNTKKSRKSPKSLWLLQKFVVLLHLGLVISGAPFEYKTILTYVFRWCTLISNIFVLAPGKRKIPPTYKQPKVADN